MLIRQYTITKQQVDRLREIYEQFVAVNADSCSIYVKQLGYLLEDIEEEKD